VAAAKISYRCSFDSAKLRKCKAKVTAKLKLGKHVLRVRAVAPNKTKSSLALVRITIKKAKKRGYAVSCRSPGLPSGGTEVVFPAVGTRLYGIRFGSGSAGIVLAQQYQGNICNWAPAVRSLVASGLQVLIYEASTSSPVAEEVAAGAGVLRKAGVTTLFVGGASMGAVAALESIPLISPRPHGLVFLSGYSTESGLDIVAHETSLAYLYLIAVGDGVVPVPDTLQLMNTTASSDKKLVEYPGTEHGVALFSGPYSSQVKNEIGTWLVARLS
jgi:hypothetical protein